MSFLAWIILGGLAGWIASTIMSTDESQGIIMNIIVGIIGAVVGGMVFNVLGTSGVTGLNLYSLAVAIIGATLFIWLVKMIRT